MNWAGRRKRDKIRRNKNELRAELIASSIIGAGVKVVTVVTQKEPVVGAERDISDRYKRDDEGDGPTAGSGEGGLPSGSTGGEGVSEFVRHAGEALLYSAIAFSIWQICKFVRRSPEGAVASS